MTTFTSPVTFPTWGFLLWHLFLSHPPRSQVNTCTQCVHLTNPCTKRTVLSLTKPKGQIYKTKALRNYITVLDMGCSLFFSFNVWETQMSCLLPFPIFFKRPLLVYWDTLRSNANSRVRRSDEPCLGSSIDDISPEQNVINQLRICCSVMTHWP